MKGKAVLSVLAAMGILALSATVAQAGSGGTPSLLTSFFVCHTIHGDDPGQELDVESPVLGPVDPMLGPLLQRIKIGKGALACAFARLFSPGSSVPIEPVEPPGTGVEQMKCYPISNAQNAKVKPPAQYTLIDALVGTEVASVPASQLQFLCAPASINLFTPE